MSNELNYTLQIRIFDIRISERYFNLKYHVTLNGKEHEIAEYSGKHARRSDLEVFKEELEDGGALHEVCQQLQF